MRLNLSKFSNDLFLSIQIFYFLISLSFLQVIGGDLQERLIPVPYSKSTTDQAVRVILYYVSLSIYIYIYLYIVYFLIFIYFSLKKDFLLQCYYIFKKKKLELTNYDYIEVRYFSLSLNFHPHIFVATFLYNKSGESS